VPADEQIENGALRRHHAKRSIGGRRRFSGPRAVGRPVGSVGVVTASSVRRLRKPPLKACVHDYRLPRLAEPSCPICRCENAFPRRLRRAPAFAIPGFARSASFGGVVSASTRISASASRREPLGGASSAGSGIGGAGGSVRWEGIAGPGWVPNSAKRSECPARRRDCSALSWEAPWLLR
jgi:hypothetical protein